LSRSEQDITFINWKIQVKCGGIIKMPKFKGKFLAMFVPSAVAFVIAQWTSLIANSTANSFLMALGLMGILTSMGFAFFDK
jgi:hypothetical protein